MVTRVVGVDIGSTVIRAVELENVDKPRPQIVKFHEIALPVGAARSGEVLETQTVASALRQLWTAAGFRSKNVVLGIGNQRVFARDLAIPKMSRVQIHESLPFHVQDLLPLPVADALLDFYPISEGTSDNGPVINGLLVAAVKDVVLANVTAVKLAGLKPVEVDLIPFALTRVNGTSLAALGTVAIVDVGATTTNVVIVSNGVPHFVRIIPAGGDDVTKSIATRVEMPEATAIQAKTALGLPSGPVAPEHRAIMEAIVDTTSELVNSIRNTLAYFDNTHDLPSVEQIVLSGGGARLRGFGAALSELTRVPVVQSSAFARFSKGKKLEADAAVSDSMTVALGLALGSAA